MDDYFRLSQLHIDAARNSTDDFNPFHDPYKWDSIRGNPFNSPIALGFQLEALIAHEVEIHRQRSGEMAELDRQNLGYSNYHFSFADVVQPGEVVQIDVKPTVDKIQSSGQLSNRVSVRKGRKRVILGFQRESKVPLVHSNRDFSALGDLFRVPDRSILGTKSYFLKRKFMNTSNAKNFLVGSMVDQHYYFDELNDRVRFPAMFPVALVSCALLEKAMSEGYDFYRRPMVYTAHAISVDRHLTASLRSNHKLHILVQGPEPISGQKGLGRSDIPQIRYNCFGLVANNRLLFRSELLMALLEDISAVASARATK